MVQQTPAMKREPPEDLKQTNRSVVTSLLLYWVGYVTIVLVAGFLTSLTIGSEVWQLTAWGLVSSLGLIFLARLLMRSEGGSSASLSLAVRSSSLRRFAFGVLLGAASFGVHVLVMATLAGPIRFELVPGIGTLVALTYFARFLSTSCMEELGFRGYPLHRLTAKIGPWPAVFLTALAFGLSHLLYGWDLRTIAIGVVPPGLLWGMSAVATRGLAVPVGLHAAWNFASWSAGSRAETGPLRMILEDDALERTQAVGTVSYLAIFGALTAAFWFVHRRGVQQDAHSTATEG